MNEFVQIEEDESPLEIGDLVQMIIVDVFETDNNGRLLSYCPTFDNRDIRKTTVAAETIRKSSSRVMSQFTMIRNSQAAARLNQGVSFAAKMSMFAAKSTYESVKSSIDERLIKSPTRRSNSTTTAAAQSSSSIMNAQGFEDALNDGVPSSPSESSEQRKQMS
jgi:hypothetical protein